MTPRDDAPPSRTSQPRVLPGGGSVATCGAGGSAREARPVLVVSTDGVVAGANAALAALVGRTASELVGTSVERVVTGTDEVLAAVRDGDEHGAAALVLRVPGRQPVPVLADWSVLHGPGGAVVVALTGRTAGSSAAYAGADPAEEGRAVGTTHRAAADGRGRIRVVDAALTEEVQQRYALARDLRTALAGDALQVRYQPVVDVASGQVVGMEALARWTSSERGPVPPASFVAVAEMTGLGVELDRWVTRRALHDAGALNAAEAVPPGCSVAVNLSAGTLADSRLDGDLRRWTTQAGLRTDQVVLEITETSVMQDTELTIATLRRLRAQGYGVAVDDFGIGYSSLAYLRDLPVTTLKIDRSFVADITTDNDALAIVASVVDLGRAVGVSVTAEGVETPSQAAALHRLGCTDAQGWLWSPAVPVDQLLDARTWLRPLEGSAFDAPSGTVARRPRRGPAVTRAHGLDRMLALHSSGASAATIAAALNSEGYRTPSGSRWHRSSIARALADAASPSSEATD